MKNIYIRGNQFKDAQGRTLTLRGVNLGGSSKVPFSADGAPRHDAGLYENREVSFVGRPFPLAEADEHFARLRKWGFNFLRLLTTWEAIEHAGPGRYDEAYLDYLHRIVRKAAEYDFNLFVDPHQDVWSRFTGGDGAPRWTLDAIGFDVTRFTEAGAALLHNADGDSLSRMIWPTNYAKLACATMFTLFFAGNDLAPLTRVDGVPVQEFLQGHYVNAVKQVAERLKGLPNVIGFDSLNEPSPGWIGREDLHDNQSLLRLGASPTPFQSLALGGGIAQEVENWRVGMTGARRNGTRQLNTQGVNVWREGCVWQRNGVWDLDGTGNPRLLRPRHFAEANGRPIDFGRDYFVPFVRRYSAALRSVDPELAIFVEPPVMSQLPRFEAEDAVNVVHAAHWYDAVTLFTKRYFSFFSVDFRTGKPVLGNNRVRRLFEGQLAQLKAESRDRLHGAPTLIGEFGIPFDLRNNQAYRTGNYARQTAALNASFGAVEANLLSATLWNYTADNTNAHGDGWNNEDLSIFSRDQQTDPADLHSGGRALRAFVRPYPIRTAGTPVKLYFDMAYRIFEFEFTHDPAVTEPTEFYIPDYRYEPEYTVELSDGTTERDLVNQRLRWWHDPAVELHWIKIYC
ncbi:MAG: cellulase family glycosylhydrolase [Ferruginibacter sp.]|nr:cellulase family glycosylhydrolase [Cytophagales bacterium]